MRIALRSIAVTTLLALSGAASAAITWDWSFTDNHGDAGSGTLTTSGLISGRYLITSLTGIWDTDAITGLEPVGAFPGGPFATNDNLLRNGTPQLDFHGFYFAVSGGPGENIYYSPAGTYVVLADTRTAVNYAGSFRAVQAPEIDPNLAAGGLALLVGGLLVVRGRKQLGVAGSPVSNGRARPLAPRPSAKSNAERILPRKSDSVSRGWQNDARGLGASPRSLACVVDFLPRLPR